MLHVRDLTLTFGKSIVIKNVHLSLRKGERVAIVGPNGSGKTTFLRALSGLHQVKEGAITINEVDITTVPASTLPIAFVPPRGLIPYFPLKKAICYPLVYRKYSRKEIAKRFEVASHIVGLDPNILAQTSQEISAGQYQRAVLVQSLMLLPERDYLFLDEPFANLDSQIKAEFMAQFVTVLEGSGLLLVTHSDEEATKLCDRTFNINTKECSIHET